MFKYLSKSIRCTSDSLFHGWVGYSFSPRRPRSDSGLVHVRHVVDKVVMGQVSLPALPLSHLSAIPPLPLIHHHFDTTEKKTSVCEASSHQTMRYVFKCLAALVRKVLSLYCLCLKELNCLTVVRVECIGILWQRIQSVFYDKLCIYRSPCDTGTDRKTLRY